MKSRSKGKAKPFKLQWENPGESKESSKAGGRGTPEKSVCRFTARLDQLDQLTKIQHNKAVLDQLDQLAH
jgi:hypothetical protein